METTNFNQLLLQTAFCCMACDGEIAPTEIELLKTRWNKISLSENIDFQEEVNILVEKLNKQGKTFLKEYLDLLQKSSLTEEEELILIDIAIKMIKADDIIQYSEIKFFKTIRHRLKVSDNKIIERFIDDIPDIEQFIEPDIMTDTFLDKITNQYLDIVNLPQFESIIISK